MATYRVTYSRPLNVSLRLPQVETLRTRQDVLAAQRMATSEEVVLLRRMCADLQV